MNISKKFPLPEYVLLDGENHLGEQLETRSIVLHIPTNTYLEVVAVDEENEKEYDNVADKFAFTFTNMDEDDERHFLLLHKSNEDAASLDKIYLGAAQWYGNYAVWLDEEISKL